LVPPFYRFTYVLSCVSPHDLRERTKRLWSEMRGVSVENVASIRRSRKFKAAYNKALSLKRKTASGLNTLLEKISSWDTVTDGHGLPDDALPDVILEQLRELWENARYSVRAAFATLKNETAPQLFYRSASTRPRSVTKLRMMNLVIALTFNRLFCMYGRAPAMWTQARCGHVLCVCPMCPGPHTIIAFVVFLMDS
jgi:hypothetical protein